MGAADRIAAVQAQLAARRADIARQKQPIRAEVDRLHARYIQQLRALVSPSAAGIPGVQAWLAGTRQIARALETANQAQERVHAAAAALFDAFGKSRPIILSGVNVSTPGTGGYDAVWRTVGGDTEDEVRRQATQTQLRSDRDALIVALDDVKAERRLGQAYRLELAEQMTNWSPVLNIAAAQYGRMLEQQFWVGLAADIGLTAAEFALTGGAATLARKSQELAERATARAAEARATAGALRGGAPVVDNLLGEIAQRSTLRAPIVDVTAAGAEAWRSNAPPICGTWCSAA